MNIASIRASLDDARCILKQAGVFKDYNKSRKLTLDVMKFSEEFIKNSQLEDYDLIHKTAMRNSDYDFLLNDDSFFQFSCVNEGGNLEKGIIRYAFYENPRVYPTYEEFLVLNGFSYEDCGEEFYMDFEQEIEEAKLKKNVTPIRYDYDHRFFKPVEHSISHIHIGHNNDIRISTSTILNPAKFVSFVLRNVYPKIWNNAFMNDEAFKELCLSSRRSCHQVNENYFEDDEKGLLHII